MSGTSQRYSFVARPEAGLAVLLFAVTLALFWPAAGFDYINLDDYPYVVENPMVSDGLGAGAVRQAFTTVREQWWLPMLWISYMADIELFGAGPQGHHVMNLLLHAANAALLFWALFRLTGSRWSSFFVAALFAWHPTRVEAVAWIAARKDVLSGLFFMLGLLAYARFARKPSPARMAGVFAWLLLGLMSKAVLVFVPFLLLVLDGWPLRRASAWAEWKPRVREKIPLFVLSGVFMALNLWTHAAGRGDGSVGALDRLGLMAPNVVAYLGKIAAPVRLSLVYPENDVVSWGVSLLAAVLLLGATGLFYRQRGKRPYVLAGWLWFLLALAPVVRGVRLGLAQLADRWTYLPLIGLGVAVAFAVESIPARGLRRGWAVLACAVLVACAGLARQQVAVWRNSETLYLHALGIQENLALLHANLGTWYATEGRSDEAVRCFYRSLELQPRGNEAHANLANLFLKLGQPEPALRHFRATLEDQPRHVQALNNLAWVLATDPAASPAQAEEALAFARRAVESAPAPDASLLDTLAVAQAAAGDFSAAVETAEEARRRAGRDGQAELARSIGRRLDGYRQKKPWKN